MPTGYTSDLVKRNFDVKTWLKVTVIRAMGVTASLRDHDWNLTEEEIFHALSGNYKYHEIELKRLKTELGELESLSQDDLADKCIQEVRIAKEKYDHDLFQFDYDSKRYKETLKIVNDLFKKSVEENGRNNLISNALAFAQEQIRETIIYEFDQGVSQPHIMHQTYQEWAKDKFESLERNIKYHTEELEKAIKHETENIRKYNEYIEFINKELLGI